MRIKRFIRTGYLWDSEHLKNSEEIIDQMGSMMDKGNVYAGEVFGDIVFEAEDGKYYYAVLEGSLEEIDESDINNVLGYETQEVGNDEG